MLLIAKVVLGSDTLMDKKKISFEEAKSLDKVKLDMLAYGKFVTPPSFFCTDTPISSYLQRGTYVSEFHVDE